MKQEILHTYEDNREVIDSRLEEFEDLKESTDYRKFQELVFVILTSRSEAEKSWEAAGDLDSSNLLMEGDREEIAEFIASHGVQYELQKAGYIVQNRQKLSQPTLQNPTMELKLNDRIDYSQPEKTRKWFAENLSGVGWKGASHFLRNVGFTDDFVIVSGHIMKKLNGMGVVDQVEPPQGEEGYMEVESAFRTLAEELDLNMTELDLTLWCMETGSVFR